MKRSVLDVLELEDFDAKLMKFRGWDDRNKKMVYWSLNDLLVRFNSSSYLGDDKPSTLFIWQ